MTKLSTVLVSLCTPPLLKPTSHALLESSTRVVDDQYLDAWKFVKGWPDGKAGSKVPRSNRLVSSLRFGKRQSPATLPSERPHAPSAKTFAEDRAVDHTSCPKQSAFFNQISPVRLSVIVPFRLSVNRGLGDVDTPFSRSPSYQLQSSLSALSLAPRPR